MLSFINQNILVDGGGFEKAIWYVLHGNRILLDEWIPQKRFEKRAKNIVNNYFDYFDNGIMPNLRKKILFYLMKSFFLEQIERSFCVRYLLHL